MNEEFKSAVAKQDLATVRMMLSNELLFDPRGETFSEMLRYAKDKMPNLFEAEEPSRFSIPQEPSEWNNQILSQMKRDLNMNFSVEKLALYEAIAKHLGGEKATKLNEEEQSKSYSDNTSRSSGTSHQTRQSESRKSTGKIMTGGGAVITLTGLCLKGSVGAIGTIGTVLSIVGGAAVIAGVTLLCVPNKTKR